MYRYLSRIEVTITCSHEVLVLWVLIVEKDKTSIIICPLLRSCVVKLLYFQPMKEHLRYLL